MSFGKNKSKTTSSATQSMNQTQDTRLSDRAYGMLKERAARVGGRQYQALDPNAYKAYMSPYQQEVIDATTADLNANRDLAANQQRADFAAAGAFGDKRRSIEEAGLQGQYDRTLATTLAGLRQSGYGQALGVAQGENANRNQYDQQTEALLNQLYSLLANETSTNARGTSTGNSVGKTSGFNLGFGYGGG